MEFLASTVPDTRSFGVKLNGLDIKTLIAIVQVLEVIIADDVPKQLDVS